MTIGMALLSRPWGEKKYAGSPTSEALLRRSNINSLDIFESNKVGLGVHSPELVMRKSWTSGGGYTVPGELHQNALSTENILYSPEVERLLSQEWPVLQRVWGRAAGGSEIGQKAGDERAAGPKSWDSEFNEQTEGTERSRSLSYDEENENPIGSWSSSVEPTRSASSHRRMAGRQAGLQADPISHYENMIAATQPSGWTAARDLETGRE